MVSHSPVIFLLLLNLTELIIFIANETGRHSHFPSGHAILHTMGLRTATSDESRPRRHALPHRSAAGLVARERESADGNPF